MQNILDDSFFNVSSGTSECDQKCNNNYYEFGHTHNSRIGQLVNFTFISLESFYDRQRLFDSLTFVRCSI